MELVLENNLCYFCKHPCQQNEVCNQCLRELKRENRKLKNEYRKFKWEQKHPRQSYPQLDSAKDF